MDAVEILLFSVVGLSVVVFLILEQLDQQISKQSGEVYDSVKRGGIQESVGGDGDAEILEREETDNLVTNASCGKTDGDDDDDDDDDDDLGSGEKEDDNICGEDDDDEYIVVDDWEGLERERSGLEKDFGEAMAYFKSNNNEDDGIGEDVKLQLYGLQKVALQGPCPHNSQPMALHLSARSKWDAWQKAGNMSGEMAMENYIAILSEAIPDWKLKHHMNHDLQQSKGEEDTLLIKIRRFLRI